MYSPHSIYMNMALLNLISVEIQTKSLIYSMPYQGRVRLASQLKRSDAFQVPCIHTWNSEAGEGHVGQPGRKLGHPRGVRHIGCASTVICGTPGLSSRPATHVFEV